MDALHEALEMVDALEPRAVILLAERFRWPALALVLLLDCVNEAALWDPNVLRWDWLFVSGYLTLVVGIALASNMSTRMAETLERLVHRGVLVQPPDQVSLLAQAIEIKGQHWAHRGGLLLSAVVFLTYVWAAGWPALLKELPETIGAATAAYVVGRVIGRMTSNGHLGEYLHKRGLALHVQPGHLDGAGGLKPVGDLFFAHAALLALPAGFLATWTVLIPVWPYHNYTRWREPYLGLLAVSLVAEVAAFVLPMWIIHEDMRAQKLDLLITADEMSRKVLELRAQLAETADAHKRAEIKDRTDLLARQYQDIEELATWPVDPPTRRRFTVNNLVMLLPMAVQIIGATSPWQSLAQALERLLTIK